MNHARSLYGAGSVLALLAAAASADVAGAQVAATPRALGTAGAYTAMARGAEALFANPANLALPDGRRWSLMLPQLTAGATVSGWEIEDFSDFLDSDEISPARKTELLNKIPAGGTEGELDLRVPLAALQVGRFAVGLSAGGVGRQAVGRDIVDLVLNGYDEDRTDYSVGDTHGSSASFLDLALGYGRRMLGVNLGVTGHYYRGLSLNQNRMFEPVFDVDNADVNVDLIGVESKGGTGFGIDLGLAMQPTSKLTISAVVNNAFSNMQWDEDLEYRMVTANKSTITNSGELLDDFENGAKPLDPTGVPFAVYQTAGGLFDEAYFPSVLRVGTEWAATRRTRFAASYQSNMTDGRLAGWWERSLSGGLEVSLPILSLRGGYATNLEEGSMISGGLSLGPVDLGAAKISNGQYAGADRTGWVATLGISIRGRRQAGDR